jgi:hypothetical protein
MSEQQPYFASTAVNYWTRIAAGVLAVIPHNLRLAPGTSSIGTTFEQQVDVPGIASAAFSAFAEGQERAVGGNRERWNAIGVIAVSAGHEQIRLMELLSWKR